MTIRDSIRLAASAIQGGVLRTLLTIISLAVGVGTVLTVLALSEAGERRVEAEIANLGVNKVWIRPAEEGAVLKAEDAVKVCEAVQAPACTGAYTMTGIISGRHMALIQVAGFDASAAVVHAPKVLSGRMFRQQEFLGESTVCLIDEVLNDYLGGDALGSYVRAANRRFRVIGVIKPMSLQTLTGGNGMMILPLACMLDTFDTRVAEITVAVQPGQETKAVALKAAETLGEDTYRTDTLEKEISAAKEIIRIFVMVLLCVAAVCMLSGGIGVMNVLLLSVRERRNEIGLIKAIGGTSRQIVLLFLLEAAVYALLGGVMGVLLGQGMILAFGRLIGLQAQNRLTDVLPVLASAAIMGICFGVVPALKAARLQPVDALRRES